MNTTRPLKRAASAFPQAGNYEVIPPNPQPLPDMIKSEEPTMFRNHIQTQPQVSDFRICSTEIATLCEKQHRSVIRDIDQMLNQLEVSSDLSSRLKGTYQDLQGKEKPCYHLDRFYAEALITGYSIPVRERVIQRLHELGFFREFSGYVLKFRFGVSQCEGWKTSTTTTDSCLDYRALGKSLM